MNKGMLPLYLVIVFIVILALISPWARWWPVNALGGLAMFMFFGYLGGVFYWASLKDKSKTVLFIMNSMRKSYNTGGIMRTSETRSGRIAGLLAIAFGGFVAKAFESPDKNLAVVTAKSVEKIHDVMVVYCPVVPLVEPRMIKTVASIFGKAIEKNPLTGFKTGAKSSSEAFFGIQNKLVRVPTSEETDRVSALADHGIIADEQEVSERGLESSVREDERMVNAVKKNRKRGPAGTVKSFMFGEPKTDSETEKPSQREFE